MKTSLKTSSIRSFLPALLLFGLALISSYQWWANSTELTAVQEATVNVHGTVTLDSLPLQSGIFQLSRADGQSINCQITNGKFHLASVPAGEWQQSIKGPGVPSLYSNSGPIMIDSSIRSLQFGLKGSEQLKLHALSLLEKTGTQ